NRSSFSAMPASTRYPCSAQPITSALLALPPHTATLFPYTTLFRSVAKATHVEAALKHNVDVIWIGARTTVNPFSVQEVADALKGDRKSTRLNSSHVSISYAVFCLKKKKVVETNKE